LFNPIIEDYSNALVPILNFEFGVFIIQLVAKINSDSTHSLENAGWGAELNQKFAAQIQFEHGRQQTSAMMDTSLFIDTLTMHAWGQIYILKNMVVDNIIIIVSYMILKIF